jgi:hypothetical protein
MTFLLIAREVFIRSFRNWRVWLIQFVANLALFGLFAAWLLIPVARSWQLAVNILVPLIFAAGVLVLNGGTMLSFGEEDETATPALHFLFLRALRNVLPLLIVALALYYGWHLTDKAASYQETFPPYLRSVLPALLRRHITLASLESIFTGVIFVARWILVPGVLLPLFMHSARRGFSVFGWTTISSWVKSLASISYWALLAIAAIVGVLGPVWLMNAKPDFKTSTYSWEMTSVIVRFSIAYLLGIAAWMETCSLVGTQAVRSALPAAGGTSDAGA